MRALIKTAAVADRLNVPVDWFYKHRRRLEAHHGFPRPVAGMRHRWDPAAIDGWLDRQIPPTAVAAGRAPDYSNVLRARLPELVRGAGDRSQKTEDGDGNTIPFLAG